MKALRSETDAWSKGAFAAAVGATLIDRLMVLIGFGLRYTGADDVVFWTAASDMANGIFREPFLYGQNYNPALESLVAVPLLWLGAPIQAAMPVATSILALAPFLSWAAWEAHRGRWTAGALLAACPALLPIEWGLMTTMTRGFVNGLALLALLPWVLSIRRAEMRDGLLGFLAAAAVAVNPNALPLAATFIVWHIWTNRGGLKGVFCILGGALPALLAAWAGYHFYAAHPERVVHRIDDWRLTFHPAELIPEALGQLDRHFAWLCPLWWPNGEAVIWLLVAAVPLFLWLRRPGVSIALAASTSVVALSFAFPKTMDGHDHVVYPLSRMFLAMPLIMGWAAAQVPWGPRSAVTISRALLIIAPLLMGWKALNLEAVIAQQFGEPLELPIATATIAALQADADAIAEISASEGIDLVVAFSNDPEKRSAVLSYAAPLLNPHVPNTLFVGHDRRYHLRSASRNAVFPTILLLGCDDSIWDEGMRSLPGAFPAAIRGRRALLLRGNGMPLSEILDRLGRDLGPLPAQ